MGFSWENVEVPSRGSLREGKEAVETENPKA